jgi:hypothetical protein
MFYVATLNLGYMENKEPNFAWGKKLGIAEALYGDVRAISSVPSTT